MGRSPCCVKEGLKKGPWTQEEDEKLIAFVSQHGHGNWRALPKKCDLLRCGKSCRLRWNNYLRPDIKRGLFTQSEEQKIIQLHALVGNKWAFIASQLPKRTDNEIKNYWNTVLKKRLEKLGLSSSMAAQRTERSTPIAAAERAQRQESNRGNMQRQDNEKNKSPSSTSKMKASCNNSTSVMSCTHLAQWENARLEAEARLAKESQSSKLAHKLFSFAYKGHSFSTSTSTSNTAFSSLISNHSTIYTNQQQLSTNSSIPPSSISNPCLIHHPSTINPLSNASSLSTLHAIVSSCSSASTSSTILSSKSFNSLASQESPLKLAPSGRLSWLQTKEMPFTTSPSIISHTSQSSLLSQLLCQIERHDNGQEIELQASTKEGLISASELKANRGQLEQLNLEATSSIVDLNSTILESSKDLNSTIENWHDFIFDVENSCSDVVSTTNWRGPISPQREEFTHDSTSLISNTIKSGPLQGTLDLEGLNLFHFDSLMSCDHYANQHSNVLMKELLWDTPTTLSISSTSIVN